MADINENTVDNVNEEADKIAEASAENISGAVTENAGGDSPEYTSPISYSWMISRNLFFAFFVFW